MTVTPLPAGRFISAEITAELLAALRAAATASGVSRSEFVRAALAVALGIGV
jgi:uncharacterized protein (DUF1778 family)